MDNEHGWVNRHRTHVTLATVVAIVAGAIVLALAVTIHGVDAPQTSREQPPGTIRLAYPHPPLDKAPGEAVGR